MKLAFQNISAMSCELVELNLKEVAASNGIEATMGMFFKGNGIACEVEPYETEDPFIVASRTALSLSIIFGGIAGLMVTFEWIICDICCATLLEGLAYFFAWVLCACTFIFYRNSVCYEEMYQQALEENNLMDVYAEYLAEGGADFLYLEDDFEGCSLTSSSHFMTVATISYFLCGAILCW